MATTLNRAETMHAIAAGRGSPDLADSVLALLQQATGTTEVVVYEDVQKFFQRAIFQIADESDVHERLVPAYLLDGMIDEANERYERLLSAGGEKKVDYLRRKGMLFLPTHPEIAKDAFMEALDLDPYDLEIWLGIGFVFAALDEPVTAIEGFKAVLEKWEYLNYQPIRTRWDARLAGLDGFAVFLATAASRGLWRLRFAQQMPHWPKYAYQSAVELRDWADARFPRLARLAPRREQAWDFSVAAGLTSEALASLISALHPHGELDRFVDVLLSPAPVPFSPDGPHGPTDVAKDREGGFKQNWNQFRERGFADLEIFRYRPVAKDDWSDRIQRAGTGDEKLRIYRTQETKLKVALGRWILTKVYEEEPSEAMIDLASLGQECARLAQRYASAIG